jgi:hypothetical protein
MYCGPSQGLRTWMNYGPLLWISPGPWSQRASSIRRYTSEGLRVQHFKRMLGGRYEQYRYSLIHFNRLIRGCFHMASTCCERRIFTVLAYERTHSLLLLRKLQSKCDCYTFTQCLRTYRHEEYRPYLIDHLLNVTLKHWDASMRAIGAQSLCLICKFDLATLGPEASHRAV